MKKILSVFVPLILLIVALGLTAYNYANSLGKTRLVGKGTFLVAPGVTFNKLVNQLVGEQPSWRIKAYGYLHPELTQIKTATYDLMHVDTLDQALALIRTGKGITVDITLIPGQTWNQWKAQFEVYDSNNLFEDDIHGLTDQQIAKLAGIKPIEGDTKFTSLEGYFLPETYKVALYTPISQILKLANQALVTKLNQAWAQKNSLSQAKTPYQLLTLASIIQKEKGNNDEAFNISSVFNNRLNRGMMLQSDPTVIYGLGDKYKGDITSKDLSNPTPYNTYTIAGLPPTPIAMVDDNSLLAAAKPTSTKYLYFVAVYGQKKHVFAKSYVEQQKNVKVYLRDYRKANK